MSIIRVTTRNSVYDVDVEGKRVRRVMGANAPTERQGEDGVWKPFMSVSMLDGGMIFQWGWNENGTANCTWTSDILNVEEVKELVSGH
jgi:hypothetical protein